MSDKKRSLSSENEPPAKKRKQNPEPPANDLWPAYKEAAPVLYDYLFHERSKYPSYDLIWIDNHNSKSNAARLMTSRSTDAAYNKNSHIWKGDPHTLEIVQANIPAPMRFPNENLSSFDHMSDNCSELTTKKRFVHPGHVTRIKAMPQFPHTVATHTNHKYTFLWNTKVQHSRLKLNPHMDPNTPQLILKGHRKNATRALDFNVHCHFVCSGGSDMRVCVWGIDDYETVLSKSESDNTLMTPSPKLKPACVFRGHESEVSEVLFHPNNMTSLCSVSLNGMLLYWDIRSGAKYTGSIENLHPKGLTTVTWNPHQPDVYVATGGSDGKVNLVDIRNFQVVKTFSGHDAGITDICWGPHSDYFATASADQTATIWDFQATEKEEQVYFKHGLHTGPLQSISWSKQGSKWNLATLANVPDPNDPDKLNAEMHVWRPTTLLTETAQAVKRLNM